MSTFKILVRRNASENNQTQGVLKVINSSNLEYECRSLELAWKENQKSISSIPKGVYTCIKREATNKIRYKHILIQDVPNRSGVCIHKGNYAGSMNPRTGHSDIEGCILVGTGFADINNDGIKDVVSSKIAFNKLMSLLPDTFELEII